MVFQEDRERAEGRAEMGEGEGKKEEKGGGRRKEGRDVGGRGEEGGERGGGKRTRGRRGHMVMANCYRNIFVQTVTRLLCMLKLFQLTIPFLVAGAYELVGEEMFHVVESRVFHLPLATIALSSTATYSTQLPSAAC